MALLASTIWPKHMVAGAAIHRAANNMQLTRDMDSFIQSSGIGDASDSHSVCHPRPFIVDYPLALLVRQNRGGRHAFKISFDRIWAGHVHGFDLNMGAALVICDRLSSRV